MRALREFWRLLNLPCRDITALISRSRDTSLSRGERFSLRLHLMYCSACRRFEKQLRQIADAARELLGTDEAPPLAADRLSDQARERIRRAAAERR